MLGLLDNHLAKQHYLFGARPAYGDFGLWGQFYEMWTDPTVGALIGGGAPHVLDWVHRMLWPRDEGAFESWTALPDRLFCPAKGLPRRLLALAYDFADFRVGIIEHLV